MQWRSINQSTQPNSISQSVSQKRQKMATLFFFLANCERMESKSDRDREIRPESPHQDSKQEAAARVRWQRSREGGSHSRRSLGGRRAVSGDAAALRTGCGEPRRSRRGARERARARRGERGGEEQSCCRLPFTRERKRKEHHFTCDDHGGGAQLYKANKVQRYVCTRTRIRATH